MEQNKFTPEQPPERLARRVGGVRGSTTYVERGQQISRCLLECLERRNRGSHGRWHILDFGCGCGRATQWIRHFMPNSVIYGCDVDGEAIKWNREHIKDVTFFVNEPCNLPNSAGFFSVVLAVSVLTHLNISQATLLLEEFWRVLKPNGLLFLTCWIGRHSNHPGNVPAEKDVMKQLRIRSAGYLHEDYCRQQLACSALPVSCGNSYYSLELLLSLLRAAQFCPLVFNNGEEKGSFGQAFFLCSREENEA